MATPANKIIFKGKSFEFVLGTTDNKDDNNNSDNRFMSFYLNEDETSIGSIRTDGNGDLVIDNISSITLKENIRSNEDECYDIVKSLRGVKYDIINGSKNVNGFIAEEVSDIYPIATGKVDGVNTISKSSLIPVLWSAVRKMHKEIEELKILVQGQK